MEELIEPTQNIEAINQAKDKSHTGTEIFVLTAIDSIFSMYKVKYLQL